MKSTSYSYIRFNQGKLPKLQGGAESSSHSINPTSFPLAHLCVLCKSLHFSGLSLPPSCKNGVGLRGKVPLSAGILSPLVPLEPIFVHSCAAGGRALSSAFSSEKWLLLFMLLSLSELSLRGWNGGCGRLFSPPIVFLPLPSACAGAPPVGLSSVWGRNTREWAAVLCWARNSLLDLGWWNFPSLQFHTYHFFLSWNHKMSVQNKQTHTQKSHKMHSEVTPSCQCKDHFS